MGLFDWTKKKVNEEDEQLRKEAEAEVAEEIKKIKKEKIKKELLAEARGENKPKENRGIEMLKMLGSDFKSSNVGTSEQMEKMLGKSGTQKTFSGDKIYSGTGSLPGSNKIAE